MPTLLKTVRLPIRQTAYLLLTVPDDSLYKDKRALLTYNPFTALKSTVKNESMSQFY